MISEICQQQGINYTSCNPATKEIIKDALKLRDIYLKLVKLGAELHEIADRQNIEELKLILMDDIDKLNNSRHDIIKLAIRLKKE